MRRGPPRRRHRGARARGHAGGRGRILVRARILPSRAMRACVRGRPRQRHRKLGPPVADAVPASRRPTDPAIRSHPACARRAAGRTPTASGAALGRGRGRADQSAAWLVDARPPKTAATAASATSLPCSSNTTPSSSRDGKRAAGYRSTTRSATRSIQPRNPSSPHPSPRPPTEPDPLHRPARPGEATATELRVVSIPGANPHTHHDVVGCSVDDDELTTALLLRQELERLKPRRRRCSKGQCPQASTVPITAPETAGKPPNSTLLLSTAGRCFDRAAAARGPG